LGFWCLIAPVKTMPAHLHVLPLIQLGIDTVPVLIGPVSYLLLSKPAKGVDKSFPLLSLLGSILPIYK
jgi:hypothetical protein